VDKLFSQHNKKLVEMKEADKLLSGAWLFFFESFFASFFACECGTLIKVTKNWLRKIK
jgi:hypothetical protein